jgi:tryptophanyl-tRNA synthetase
MSLRDGTKKMSKSDP